VPRTEVGLHPDIVAGDKRHLSLSGTREVADVQADVGDDTIAGRVQNGAIDIELCVGDGDLGLEDPKVLFTQSAEVLPGLFEIGLGGFDVGDGRRQRGLGVLQPALRDRSRIFGPDTPHPDRVLFGPNPAGLGCLDRGLRRGHVGS
jgi:hypothetical protein